MIRERKKGDKVQKEGRDGGRERGGRTSRGLRRDRFLLKSVKHSNLCPTGMQ